MVKFNQRKPYRRKSQYEIMQPTSPFWWFDKPTKQWFYTEDPDSIDRRISNFIKCESVREFRRRLKRSPKIKFILTCHLKGHFVTGIGIKK